MAEITVFGETLRHLRGGEWQQAGDVLRHEGLKHGVESGLHLVAASELGRRALHRAVGYWDADDFITSLAGKALMGPTGVAAGWDKTGRDILAWQALGANHITVGGITYYPQGGNPMPRLYTFDRHLGDHGKRISLNRYGFYSPGVDAVREIIARQRDTADVNIPVIGQVTLNKECYQPENVQYIPSRLAATTLKILPVVDAISLGISSPNTPGMRAKQDNYAFIRDCLRAVRAVATAPDRNIEVYYKVDGDGGNDRIDRVCKLIVEEDIDGLELINTTTLEHIKGKYGAAQEAGGLAGADPDFQELALASVRRAYENIGDKKKIHGMGGINSKQQNLKMITAGASVTSINSYIRQGGLHAIRDVEEGLADIARQRTEGDPTIWCWVQNVRGIDTDRGIRRGL